MIRYFQSLSREANIFVFEMKTTEDQKFRKMRQQGSFEGMGTIDHFLQLFFMFSLMIMLDIFGLGYFYFL